MENNIHKELKEIAPNLASIQKTNPFLVPSGYFSSLDKMALDISGRIDAKVDIPKNYFENLPSKIIAQVKEDNSTKVISINKWRWAAVAASFLVIVSAGFLVINQTSPSTINNEFVDEVSTHEALEYLIAEGDLTITDVLDLDLLDEEIFYNTHFEEDELGDIILDDILDDLSPKQLEDLL